MAALLVAAVAAALAVPEMPPPAAARSLRPVADAHVAAAHPRTNYGALRALAVRRSPAARAYLRFDVGDVRGVVRSAKLRVFVARGSRAGLRVHPVPRDDWDETAVTWTNAPAPRRATTSTGALRDGRWRTIDVTRLFRRQAVVTLALTTTGETTVRLASREAGRRAPRLVVGFDPVLVAAGDIASCASDGDEATARLIAGIRGTVATLGDNVYPAGTPEEFAACYDPSWGVAKRRTRSAPGNHDYGTEGARGYFDYFGAAAGDPAKGYYSYDLGAWHVVVLNSNCSLVGGCESGSPQERWLRADLAAHPRRCTLAYWHHPRFSSGPHGGNAAMQPFWAALFDHGADVVLNGHDHDYERFAPQTPSGELDHDRGIREFVVGTGGRSHYAIAAPTANSEAHDDETFGVLALTLRSDGYRWEFLPAAGARFRDSGSAPCH